MNSRTFQWALLGAAMGLVIALVPACTTKCGPDNCATGCCSTDNKCVTSITTSACGANGGACGVCSEGQLCEAGACVTPMVEDGGTDAGPPPCTQDADCATQPGTVCDVPTGLCIKACVSDFDCLDKMNGSICDNRNGHCVMGQGCNFDSDCQSLDSEDKCYKYGQQCICDTRDQPNASSQGTCRLRKGACEACAIDHECGNDTIIFGPPEGIGAGKCAQLMGDTSGNKYCLYQRVGQCACGTIDDGTGYCKPQSNSCGAGRLQRRQGLRVGLGVLGQPPRRRRRLVRRHLRAALPLGLPEPAADRPRLPARQHLLGRQRQPGPHVHLLRLGALQAACQGDPDCQASAAHPSAAPTSSARASS